MTIFQTQDEIRKCVLLSRIEALNDCHFVFILPRCIQYLFSKHILSILPDFLYFWHTTNTFVVYFRSSRHVTSISLRIPGKTLLYIVMFLFSNKINYNVLFFCFDLYDQFTPFCKLFYKINHY